MLAFNSISKFKQYQTILLCISVYTIYYIYVQKQLECCFQFSPWFIDVYSSWNWWNYVINWITSNRNWVSLFKLLAIAVKVYSFESTNELVYGRLKNFV